MAAVGKNPASALQVRVVPGGKSPLGGLVTAAAPAQFTQIVAVAGAGTRMVTNIWAAFAASSNVELPVHITLVCITGPTGGTKHGVSAADAQPD